MTRVLAVAAIVLVAVLIAVVARRRRPEAAPINPAGTLPAWLQRTDFARAEAPWLVVLFSSTSCASCATARRTTAPVASSEVVVTESDYETEAALHRRYGIDAVPTVVIADADGVVRAGFLGPPTAADLWATLAELREPGSVPPGCDHGT